MPRMIHDRASHFDPMVLFSPPGIPPGPCPDEPTPPSSDDHPMEAPPVHMPDPDMEQYHRPLGDPPKRKYPNPPLEPPELPESPRPTWHVEDEEEAWQRVPTLHDWLNVMQNGGVSRLM